MAAPQAQDRQATVDDSPSRQNLMEQVLEAHVEQLRHDQAKDSTEWTSVDARHLEDPEASPGSFCVASCAGKQQISSQLAAKLPATCCDSKDRGSLDPLCDWCHQQSDHRSESQASRKRPKGGEPGTQLEHLIHELFRAHDLNSDGMLDESELIQLNEAVAEVHDGYVNEDVQRKYSVLFREKFDPEGRPVPYSTFRAYMLEMLDEIDRHENAQEMMVEQFLAEARLARTVVTGAPLLVDRPRSGNCYHACLRFCPQNEAATEVRP